MNNFFSSVSPFIELLDKGNYACNIVRSNRIGFSKDLTNMKAFKNCPQDTTLWHMHADCCMSCVM